LRNGILPYKEKEMLLFCMPPEDEDTPVATPENGLRKKLSDRPKMESAGSLRDSLDSHHMPRTNSSVN
jgi:hypothetical protein